MVEIECGVGVHAFVSAPRGFEQQVERAPAEFAGGRWTQLAGEEEGLLRVERDDVGDLVPAIAEACLQPAAVAVVQPRALSLRYGRVGDVADENVLEAKDPTGAERALVSLDEKVAADGIPEETRVGSGALAERGQGIGREEATGE